jgi:hypothetical protein
MNWKLFDEVHQWHAHHGFRNSAVGSIVLKESSLVTLYNGAWTYKFQGQALYIAFPVRVLPAHTHKKYVFVQHCRTKKKDCELTETEFLCSIVS